jgi:membrane dipeptidase
MKIKILLSLVLIFLIKPAEGQTEFQVTDSILYLKAIALSKSSTVVDTHIDLPPWIFNEEYDQSDKGEIDYVRAVEGGLDVAFLAIYTPPSLEGTGRAKLRADSLIDRVNRVISGLPDEYSFVRSTSDVFNNLNTGKVMIALGMENGSPVENNLNNLEEYYDKGIRYLTLSHYKWNHISDSANDPERKWNGLSPFGEELIQSMNRIGMMIDVSHISDSAFYDVIRLSKAPVIASHSSCRYFIPGNERNMSDEMIKELAAKNGVIQINFASFFLVDSIFRQMESIEAELENYLQTNHIERASPEGRSYSRKFIKDNPLGKASVKDAADHIDHVVNLVGVDYVGIGSDYNGVGDNLPVGLEDVSKIPNLIYELLSRGYTEEDIRKISGGNILRVWKEVEGVSGLLK